MPNFISSYFLCFVYELYNENLVLHSETNVSLILILHQFGSRVSWFFRKPSPSYTSTSMPRSNFHSGTITNSYFILFIYFAVWLRIFFFLGVNSIDFFVCEIHCGASELGGTYFAQGNFFPFLCLFTEKMSCLCGFCLCAFDFWPRIKMLNLFMYLKNQFLK